MIPVPSGSPQSPFDFVSLLWRGTGVGGPASEAEEHDSAERDHRESHEAQEEEAEGARKAALVDRLGFRHGTVRARVGPNQGGAGGKPAPGLARK